MPYIYILPNQLFNNDQNTLIIFGDPPPLILPELGAPDNHPLRWRLYTYISIYIYI